MKRALSLLLALLMAASLVMPQAWAAGLQEPEPDAVVQQTQPDTAEPDAQLPQADTLAGNAAGLTPITRTKNAVASGVTLEKVVMRNVNGLRRGNATPNGCSLVSAYSSRIYPAYLAACLSSPIGVSCRELIH